VKKVYATIFILLLAIPTAFLVPGIHSSAVNSKFLLSIIVLTAGVVVNFISMFFIKDYRLNGWVVFLAFVAILNFLTEPLALKNERLIFYMLLITFFGTVPRFLWNDRGFIKTLALFFVIISLIETSWGFLQHYSLIPVIQKGYVSGSFFNPNFLAGYLAILFPVIAAYYFEVRRESSKYYSSFLIFLMVCIVTLMLVTRSRAAFVSVVLTISYGLYIFYKPVFLNSKIFEKYKLFLGIAAFVVVGMLMLLLFNYKYDSALGRLLIWNVTFSMLPDVGFAGVGLGNFEQHYMNFQSAFFEHHGVQHKMSQLASNVFYAFNDYLQLMVEAGILGILMVVVFAYLIFKLTKHLLTCDKPGLREGFSLSVLSFSVISLFSYQLLSPPHMILVTISMSVSVNRLKLLSSYRTGMAYVGKGVVLFVFTGVLATSFLFIPKYYNFLHEWQHAQVLYRQGKFERSIDYFEKASQSGFCAGDFYANYGKALFLLQRYEPALEYLKLAELYKNSDLVQINLGNTYDAMGLYMQAENKYRSAINMVPSRFYSRLLLMQNLYMQHKTEESLRVGAEILQMPVKIPSPAVDSIRNQARHYIYLMQNN
jgi:O-antigen polymerase